MQLTPTQVLLVFVPYGAVFFAIGVAIISRRKVLANLKVAGQFWLLAGFAFVQSFYVWLEMYRNLPLAQDAQLLIYLRHVSLLLALVSFLFLFMFGATLVITIQKKARFWLSLLFGLVCCLFIVHLALQLSRISPELLYTIEFDMRLLFALPASLLVGVGFIFYARQLNTQKVRGADRFQAAGYAFLAYAIVTGAVPSGTLLIMPIEIYRALSAFVILHFLMYALDTFMDQREEMIADRLQLAANSEKLSAIGRLAAGIAHEINNPLANASLQLEMFCQNPQIKDLPEKIAARLETIEKSIAKSSRIAKELLIFAGGKNPNDEHVRVSLEAVVKSAWDMAFYRSRNHHLSNNLPTLPAVEGDHLKLEELFLNLFLNAIDAMPKGGPIEVSGWRDAHHVIIQVTDAGTGIAEAERGRVMEPFFTTKEVGQGTGLGLSICYGIMEHHSGSIELVPRADQRGTRVILIFPLPPDADQDES